MYLSTSISFCLRKSKMPLLSPEEVQNLKLKCIPLPQLKELATLLGCPKEGRAAEIIRRISEKEVDTGIIDKFMRQKYLMVKVKRRQEVIPDEELKQELLKVQTFSWGVIQGQLDPKIQTQYVRQIAKYDELLARVRARLHEEITNYVVCTWYNYWTTCLIEEHIGLHPKVIPALKNIKGIDIFFEGQPFDLKVSYVPRGYDPKKAVENPKDLAIWMYEHQGTQRFGADNRVFVILLDKEHPERSWEVKRDFDLVFRRIDEFLHRESVSPKDEVTFSFRQRTYKAIAKVLLVTKP